MDTVRHVSEGPGWTYIRHVDVHPTKLLSSATIPPSILFPRPSQLGTFQNDKNAQQDRHCD